MVEAVFSQWKSNSAIHFGESWIPSFDGMTGVVGDDDVGVITDVGVMSDIRATHDRRWVKA